MDQCKHCVWVTPIMSGRVFCPFPTCAKERLCDASKTEKALSPSAVSDPDPLNVLRTAQPIVQYSGKRIKPWIQRPMAKSKGALLDFESVVQEVLREQEAGASDGR